MIEPALQLLSGESFHYVFHCLDVSVQGFWGDYYQRVFFDIRVFDLTAPRYRNATVTSLYRRFECDKQRMYQQCMRDVEMGSFTPLVFWGMGSAAITVGIAACYSVIGVLS